MKPEQWQVIEELYHSASALPVEERRGFLEEACGQDRGLFEELESLLSYGPPPRTVLDTAAIALLAKAMAADQRDLPAPLSEGQSISHYRIVERIGRGGMGVVYKAEDLRLRRYVALKLLPGYLAADQEALKRFEREAQAASTLNHPNICTVYEVDDAQGLHFIAIELLEGETLKARIASGPLEIQEVLRIGVEICDALEAAHSAGVVHRDIKPSNIVLTRRGTVKLLDFGIAKCLGTEPVQEAKTIATVPTGSLELHLTNPGTVLGTADYMSPEQARGQEVDGRSDLFSLGAVLYEMTTGKRAFQGKDAGNLFPTIHERTPLPIDQLKPKAPAELIRITKKALHQDRAQRYQHAADMRQDLEALHSRLGARTGRRRAWLASASIVLLLALAAFGSLRFAQVRNWMLRSSSPGVASEIKSLAVLPLANLTGDSSQEYFVDGMTDALITNLAKIGSLRIISRTSAMHYKGTHKAPSEIAHELNVDALVEGSVIRSENRVRITAQLVDAANDRSLWAHEYESHTRDIIQLENELARAVAQEVAGRLSPQEQARFAPDRSVDPEAYDAYLKGRYFSNRLAEQELKKAVAFFQESVRHDPKYAPAYSGLADAYSNLGFVAEETPSQLAIEAARKAISLDESLAEAHASLGWILYRYQQDWSGAEKELRRAIELNPNYERAHRFYGHFFRAIGRNDLACKENRLAHELDPLNIPDANNWAQCVSEAGHFDEAVRMVEDILAIDPDNVQSLWTLGEVYERRGMFREAIAQYEKSREATQGKAPIPFALLASAYAASGQTDKAAKILREMNRRFGEDKWISAGIHVVMGKKEQAIHELTDDLDCGPGTCGPAASLYIWNWRFAPLRGDPRFQELLKKFNYPESAFQK